jgi:hypothetical protein
VTADYAQAVRDGQAWAALEDGQIVGFAIIIARTVSGSEQKDFSYQR